MRGGPDSEGTLCTQVGAEPALVSGIALLLDPVPRRITLPSTSGWFEEHFGPCSLPVPDSTHPCSLS